MVSKLLRFVVVEVAWSRDSFVSEDALAFSVFQCFLFDLFLQAEKWSELLSDFTRDVLVHLDFLLAARAGHEAECDAQG